MYNARIAHNIKWDYDCFCDLLTLPNTVSIPDNVEIDDIADYLSDKYNFCVSSFKFVVFENTSEQKLLEFLESWGGTSLYDANN